MPSSPESPLLFAELRAARRFGPIAFPVTEELVRSFAAITGDDDRLYRDPAAARAAGLPGPVVPPGLAGVWARRAYLGDRRMLPGGVMAGQDIAFRAPAVVGEALELAAEVVEVYPGHPRRRVVLACEARDASGRSIGDVRIDARWPEDGDR